MKTSHDLSRGGRVRLLGGAAAGPPDRCFATLEEQPGGRPTPGRGAAGHGVRCQSLEWVASCVWKNDGKVDGEKNTTRNQETNHFRDLSHNFPKYL